MDENCPMIMRSDCWLLRDAEIRPVMKKISLFGQLIEMEDDRWKVEIRKMSIEILSA